MKNLIALFVVALLATTATFANTNAGLPGSATGTLEVEVVYPDIQVTPVTQTLSIQLKPGETYGSELDFEFGATGAPGIDLTAEGIWSGDDLAHFEILNENEYFATKFSNAGLADFTYAFGVKCKTGTPRLPQGEKYTMTYTLTVNY